MKGQNPDPDILPNNATQIGCKTIMMGIVRCRSVYLASTKADDSERTTSQLVTSLRNPRTVRLLSRIAGMQETKALIFESRFGLHAGVRPLQEPYGFIYNRLEPCFDPNPEVLSSALDRLEAVTAVYEGMDS